MKENKIVEILWNDSQQMRGWQDKDEYLPMDNSVHSVGFLVDEDDMHIVICDSISEHQYNNPFAIIKASIVSMKNLETMFPKQT